jgi:ABC-2 type transport system permease protein
MIFTKLYTISRYTFLDLLKSKIFYVTLLVGLATMIMTYVATEFTYGVPEKVALDFGIGMFSLSSLAISIFMGAGLLSQEIESRTLYMVISRPVPRWVFILGKLLGLISVLLINLVILSTITLLTSYFLGGKISGMSFIAIGFTLLESVLLLLIVVFFSLFSNPTLSTLISLVLLVSGHAVKETQSLSFVESRPLLKIFLELYHLLLPAFYKLNFKEFLVYHQMINTQFVISSLLYGLFFSIFFLFLIITIFNRKNLD